MSDIYIGMVVNAFTVISVEYKKSKNTMIKIQCKCGNIVEISRWRLLNKPPKVCSMCNRKAVKDNVDPIKNKLRDLWTKIKQRLSNPTGRNACYKGISMSVEWSENFEAFYTWALDNGYQKGLTIDRKDSSKDYSADNCRWATRVQQSQNRNKTKNNTTGYKGVYKRKPRNGRVIYNNTYDKPYYTIIIYDGQRIVLHGYASAEEAYQARLSYIKEHYDGLVVP